MFKILSFLIRPHTLSGGADAPLYDIGIAVLNRLFNTEFIITKYKGIK